MHGFLHLTEIDPTFSFFLTMFAILVIINAFNLIDGIDGLAATLSIISVSLFGLFFYLNGNMFDALLACCFAASLVAFLIYNFSPAKIFMGDTGSILSGLVSAAKPKGICAKRRTTASGPRTTSPQIRALKTRRPFTFIDYSRATIWIWDCWLIPKPRWTSPASPRIQSFTILRWR